MFLFIYINKWRRTIDPTESIRRHSIAKQRERFDSSTMNDKFTRLSIGEKNPNSRNGSWPRQLTWGIFNGQMWRSIWSFRSWRRIWWRRSVSLSFLWIVEIGSIRLSLHLETRQFARTDREWGKSNRSNSEWTNSSTIEQSKINHRRTSEQTLWCRFVTSVTPLRLHETNNGTSTDVPPPSQPVVIWEGRNRLIQQIVTKCDVECLSRQSVLLFHALALVFVDRWSSVYWSYFSQMKIEWNDSSWTKSSISIHPFKMSRRKCR